MQTNIKKSTLVDVSSYILIGIIALLVLFNQYQIMSFNGVDFITGAASGTIKLSANADVNEILRKVIPTGIPAYGNEIGVSFDDPVKSLSRLVALDKAVPDNSLSQEEKQKYINTASRISCEFCCSAPAVIDKNGKSLCGCNHAQAIRGLAKYLSKNYPDMSETEILTQLTKWKTTWYPKSMVEKAVLAHENGLELTPDVLNDRALMQKLKAGHKNSVGNLDDIPEMVGGC